MPDHDSIFTEPPEILFQYCDVKAIDVFTNNRIKTSTPSTLNDPFEWKPRIDETVTPDQIWRMINGLHAIEPLPEPPSRVGVARMMANAPDAARRRADSFGLDLERHTRIICLTQRDDGILMWAHYADRHKGFVIGFKSKQLRVDLPSSGFCEVSYKMERPIVPHPYVAPPSGDQLITAVSRKSPEWTYEEEWRLLVDTSQLRKDSDPDDPNLYLPIPNDSVDRVIFGSRCSEEVQERVAAALIKSPSATNVSLFKARLDPKLFKVLVEPL
jgi:hypothetical protein